MAIDSSARRFRSQPVRGFESEPSDEWREDYGRGGPVRSNEPERDWFFEQNADGHADSSTASARTTDRQQRVPDSFRGRGPKGYRPRDERIQELICERLTEHPRIDASEIAVEVECGIVRLQGTIATDAMKQALLQVVRASIGVIGVLDEVQVDARSQQ